MASKKDVSELDTKNPVTEDATAADNAGAATPENTNKPPAKARYDGVTSFVYVGPSLPGGRLKSLTTLSGTYEQITDYYKEAIELFPNVARLIVPVTQLAETREKTQKSGNVIYNCYQELAAAIKAKGVEQ